MAANKSDNPFMDMFQKFGENLQLPTADVSSVMDYHKKNIQAFQDVVQVTSSGTRNLMNKQREALEETLADISEMIKTSSANRDPSQMMNNQMEFARKSFEATIKNTTEMGTIIRDMNMESYNVLKNRVEESISDIREGMTGGKDKS